MRSGVPAVSALELSGEAIGVDRVDQVLHSAGLPGVGIGGITPENAQEVFGTGAGIAVLGSVMHAEDPGAVVRRLVEIGALSQEG